MARKPRGRGNGEGTVITFKSKGKIIGYAAEMTIGWDEAGKRQKVRSSRFKLRTDADAALVKMRKQHEQGVKLDAKPQTFEDYLEEWIEGIALVHRPRTVVTYQWAIDKHIVPAWQGGCTPHSYPDVAEILQGADAQEARAKVDWADPYGDSPGAGAVGER